MAGWSTYATRDPLNQDALVSPHHERDLPSIMGERRALDHPASLTMLFRQPAGGEATPQGAVLAASWNCCIFQGAYLAASWRWCIFRSAGVAARWIECALKRAAMAASCNECLSEGAALAASWNNCASKGAVSATSWQNGILQDPLAPAHCPWDISERCQKVVCCHHSSEPPVRSFHSIAIRCYWVVS